MCPCVHACECQHSVMLAEQLAVSRFTWTADEMLLGHVCPLVLFFSGDQTEQSRCCNSQCLSSPLSLILYVMLTPVAYRLGSNNSQRWLKLQQETWMLLYTFLYRSSLLFIYSTLCYSPKTNRGRASFSSVAAASSLMYHKTAKMALTYPEKVR